jgi:hypothetical protein
MLRTVRAVRYVMPFREGGSVPALVEADDLGLYVVKLRAAGQGARALVAELVAGEIGRALGLKVPEIVLVVLERELAASEPDPELCLPLEASAGLNLGLDYLPGSIAFDPVVGPLPDPVTASRIVLFDAFVANVDRTPRNTNLLAWHRRLWLIDHGAALYFHHGWDGGAPLEGALDPFVEVKHHVLLAHAGRLNDAAEHLARSLGGPLFEDVVSRVPAGWIDSQQGFVGAEVAREGYVAWLRTRLAALPLILEEAERAHSLGL